jgi:hypothetical protein
LLTRSTAAMRIIEFLQLHQMVGEDHSWTS